MSTCGQYQFTIDQGATFERTFTYKDSDGNLFDLSNYSARLQIRPTETSDTIYGSYTSTIGLDGSGITLGGVSGSITLTISAASTSMFSFDQAHYDLEIASGSGVSEYVIRILKGRMKLDKNVTR